MGAGRWLAWSWILIAAGGASTGVGLAEEEAPLETPPAAESAATPEGGPAAEGDKGEVEEEPAPVVKRVRRGGPREKDADGTEASKRFEADAIIKSPYRDKRGDPYEVDTE